MFLVKIPNLQLLNQARVSYERIPGLGVLGCVVKVPEEDDMQILDWDGIPAYCSYSANKHFSQYSSQTSLGGKVRPFYNKAEKNKEARSELLRRSTLYK